MQCKPIHRLNVESAFTFLQEIPWMNIWNPECIIRKHFRVTLHEKDTEAKVQVIVNEGNNILISSFLWQV